MLHLDAALTARAEKTGLIRDQAATGRFIERYPIGYAGGLNLYTYCSGDPINKSDPTGFEEIYPDESKYPSQELVDFRREYGLPNATHARMQLQYAWENDALQSQITVHFLRRNPGMMILGARSNSTSSGKVQPGGIPSQRYNSSLARSFRDVNVSSAAPQALPLNRPIGSSTSQNAAFQQHVVKIQLQGATNIRVNQQQIDLHGNRVGINRPDLQYTLNGQRYYVEYDTPSSGRGPGHMSRIMSNDPMGIVELFIHP